MIKPDRYFRLKMKKKSAHGILLTDGESDVLLPASDSVPSFHRGKEIDVFVYNNRDSLRATERRPFAVQGEFAALTVIRAVQGLAGQDTGYASWFDALAAMQRQMDETDYEVAIVGAGAYSLPLAAHARDTGHAAVQMSGATQLLFGIKGKRWDAHPVIRHFYNDAWVRPAEHEGIARREAVEGGSYW